MKIVYVQWVDHCSHTEPWTKIEESRRLEPVVVHSVGYVLHETKDRIILASSYNTEDQVSGDTLILKCCITKKTVLRP